MLWTVENGDSQLKTVYSISRKAGEEWLDLAHSGHPA